MSQFYNRILNRTIADTGVDREVLETIIRCFLIETSHELAVNSTIELPFIGDISQKTINKNKFLKDLIKQGGLHASNIYTTYENSSNRNSKRIVEDRDGSKRSGTDGELGEN